MRQLSFLRTYGIYYFLLFIVLLILSYQFGSIKSEQSEIRQVASKLSARVVSLETEIEKNYSDSSLKRMILDRSYWQKLPSLYPLPYEGLLYRNDTLIFWTQNLVIPQQAPESFGNEFSFQQFRNGYYIVYHKSLDSAAGNNYHLLVLLPVKYEYVTVNSYLRPHFSELFDAANYFVVSPAREKNYLPVNDASGKTLFYLGRDPADFESRASLPSLLLFFAAFLFFIIWLHHLLNRLPDRRQLWVYPTILTILFFCLYYLLSDKRLLPSGVVNGKLFDPELFASAGVASSLGGLLLQLLFLLWCCIYITNKLNVRIRIPTGSFLSYSIHIIGYFIIFFLSIYAVDVIRALVRDSKIQFAYLNPLEPDYYSIIGVVCIALLFICLFLLSLKITSIIDRQPLRMLDKAMVLLICTMLAFAYYLSIDTGISGLWIMLWINVFVVMLPYFNIWDQNKIDFARVFLLLVFISASGSLLLQVYGEKKEKDIRMSYAKKLISEGDAVTEYLLADLQTKIPHDEYVVNFYKPHQFTARVLKDRLQQDYFQEGFSRYAINYYPFNLDGFIPGDETDAFGNVTENGLRANMQVIIPNQLYYITSPSGTFTYLAEYQVMDEDTLLGRLYVELTANSFKSAGVYPELLLEEKDKLPDVTPQYSFAIYHNQHLIEQSGDYFYDYHLRWLPDERREGAFINEKNYNHLIYNSNADTEVVVTKKNNWFYFFTSYFSFLFVVFFSITLLVLIFNALGMHADFKTMGRLISRASLRTLIHGFFMMFMLAVLLIIAYITGTFFLNQFKELSQQTVTDKMSRINESVQILLNQNYPNDLPEQVSGMLKQNVALLAKLQDIDINFYDLHGDLITSSQPSFFEKGLISRKMNPLAFRELSNEGQTVLVKEETVGTLDFYSGYQCARDLNGAPVVFIHLPYFNSRENLNEQVGFFFVALVNILVLATILAGLLAPLISRQITRKLSLIAERFKKVRVGAGNELLEWHASDEIGSLVSEYNKMLLELESSAEKLAKSQRERAWREMARQVAHEIKNPLTPMKLSIQHLQRAYEKNAPNLSEMTMKVSNTLIEQIENLNRIATEFSNFAQMPNPDFEKVNVNDVIQSASDLHKENGNVSVHLRNYAEESMVSADKNQLLSVFNNLILNAIQSIPEDQLGSINIVSENYDEQVVVSVSDNGVGISDEEGKRLFTPNFTTKSSGTGLGLAISKKIVESFGGNISFISEKNIGTTFFVKLPLLSNGHEVLSGISKEN